MKQINEYISQKWGGSQFENEVKYSKGDWNQWVNMWKEDRLSSDIFIGELNDYPDLVLVYKQDHKEKIFKHIATYNKKTETLSCDDVNLFGNPIK